MMHVYSSFPGTSLNMPSLQEIQSEQKNEVLIKIKKKSKFYCYADQQGRDAGEHTTEASATKAGVSPHLGGSEACFCSQEDTVTELQALEYLPLSSPTDMGHTSVQIKTGYASQIKWNQSAAVQIPALLVISM